MKLNPLTCIDFYKVSHIKQYPPNTEYIYSNFTPRSSLDGSDFIIFFGLQYYIKYFLIDLWNEEFFKRPKKEVLKEYKRIISNGLGGLEANIQHIEDLHDLGYLPLEIKALPEGSKVPLKVPVLTVINTDPRFFWLTNYIETSLSCLLWKMCTSATTAFKYKQLLTKYAKLTGCPKEFVNYQAHDFSFRGMSSVEDAAMSGAGHLTSFYGTDTIPAIELLEKYYGAENSREIVGCSVPATEHSVMCAWGQKDEFKTFKHLITEVHPEGVVSIVADTWDLWKVVDEYLPALREEIINRNGRVVIRPDSGDPVDISLKVCEKIYKSFPGDNGRIHNNLGVIYGDSITLDRCKQILEGLYNKGLCSSNMIFGIGSYTYQYKTRDNYGFAMKATWAQVNGKPRNLYKNPITDSGNKRSATGLLSVIIKDGNYILLENVSVTDEARGELNTVFRNGVLYRDFNLKDIRTRVNDAIVLP